MQPVEALILPPKFDPFIINNFRGASHPLSSLCDALDNIFKNNNEINQPDFQKVNRASYQVVTHPSLPGYIIKGDRYSYRCEVPTTHIYRLRKALRLQKIIEKYHFESEIKIPTKYLYRAGNKWYVVVEKLDVNENVNISRECASFSRQKYRPLTDKQVQALACLCFEGKMNDLGEHNVLILNDGKLAIIDTEPLDRHKIKNLKSFYIPGYTNSRIALIGFERVLVETNGLFRLCNYSQKINLVKMQKSYALKHIAKLVCKTVLPLVVGLGALLVKISIASSALTLTASAVLVFSVLYAWPLCDHLHQSIKMHSLIQERQSKHM